MENQIIDQQFENNNSDYKPWGMEVNQFNMFMHLSQLTSFIVPLAGLILPIVMWATNKDHSPKVDLQGKNIVNWMITLTIASIAGIILTFIFIGVFVLLAVGIASVVFAILGAIKSNEGELYEYPFSFKFIK